MRRACLAVDLPNTSATCLGGRRPGIRQCATCHGRSAIVPGNSVHQRSLCRWATAATVRDAVFLRECLELRAPGGGTIRIQDSHTTPAGSSPASRARSTAAAVADALETPPPEPATKMSARRSRGHAGQTATRIARRRSCVPDARRH
jgi:hypothetical protein